MKTRILFVLAFSLIVCSPIFGQVQFVPNSAHRLNIGVGGGLARLYGDLPNRKMTPVGRLNFEYRLKEYLTLGLEAQIGTLESGMKNAVAGNTGRYGRDVSWGLHSMSGFQAAHVYGRVAVGMFTEDNEDLSLHIKNIYGGIGVGVIRNNIGDIVKAFPENKKKIADITDKTIGIALPISVGINADVPNTNITGNFNIQYSLTNMEGLDGYDFGSSSLKNDGYLFISVGIKYNFGPLL
jgi:hypothetical protein